MRGTSAASLETVRAGFEPMIRSAGEQAAALGAELFTVVDALLGSASLRRALSDPARPADDKAGLVRRLLAAADPRVAGVVEELARARWSSEEDLVDATEELAAHGVLASAQAGGELERVEDELFRFDRALIGQRELRRSMVALSATPAARSALVERLLTGKVHPATVQLVARGAQEPRGRTMSAMLGRMGRLAALRRELLVATVTSAAALSPEQAERLRTALTRTYGRPVHLAMAIDPELIGGMRVRVGSQVVDATLLGRLDDVRRRLAG